MHAPAQAVAEVIESRKTSLGIELGSTRIKAVLIGEGFAPIASGEYGWENGLVDGVWTYSLADVWHGVQACYASLKQDVLARYGMQLNGFGSLGISGMMHGYLVFDRHKNLLTPFRTWRNTITEKASTALTELLRYPIPHRWSIAHLYQAILNGEPHVPEIAFMTTLAGYVHWQLTGEYVVGIGEASGMFPIDTGAKGFNRQMIARFDQLVVKENYGWKLLDILPSIKLAGEAAGVLTENGARLLDPAGALAAGVPVCAPEGDAGTGMVATNSVTPHTGNVSAGTSVFLMAVLAKEPAQVHPEIDLVTTPVGDLVAMVHCNNCTGDIDAWVNVFEELGAELGQKTSRKDLYDTLYKKALAGDPDCGGLLSCNYISGESITGMEEGRPLLMRMPDSRFTLANLMRANLYAAVATLRIGVDVLVQKEGMRLEKICGHGGFFKTQQVGQQIMASALNIPVTVTKTAGEGGAWGMALLAAYSTQKKPGEALGGFLSGRVFATAEGSTVKPVPGDVAGFNEYMKSYLKGLDVERSAVAVMRG